MNGKKNGITLISLIITIVIMLILAAVALNLVLGDNGLFKKSKDAVSIYDESKDKEDSDLKEEEKIYSLYIQDLDDLIAFRDSVNAGNTYADTTVYLVNDIDLQESEDNQWTPIGDVYNCSVIDNEHLEINKLVMFCGNFQGNGHTISNIYMDIDNYDNNSMGVNLEIEGFFGYINHANINDLTVTGNIIKNKCSLNTSEKKIGQSLIGSICGNGAYSNINNCNSHVNIQIDNTYISDDVYESSIAGGITGNQMGSNVNNCINYGNINGNLSRIGGVICDNYGNIKNCYNYGNLTNNYYEIGGIAVINNKVIDNCMNYGKILNNQDKIYDEEDFIPYGGIVARNNNNALIINCENNGEVEVNLLNTKYINGIGGIAGENENGLIYACINKANIYGNYGVGGIAGYNRYCIRQKITLKNQGIYNSINLGEVSGDLNNGNCIGGAVGYSSLPIVNCCNVGNVKKASKDAYNSIVGAFSYVGKTYNEDTDKYDTIDLKAMNINKVVNCYALDSSELSNHEVKVRDVNSTTISDTSDIEIIRKDKSYMKSETFVHDLKDDIWAYRFNNYPGLKEYSGDVLDFYNTTE